MPNPSTSPLRVLLVGAPPAEAAEAVRALEAAGLPVASASARKEREIARAVRGPFDLVLVWDGVRDGDSGPGPHRVIEWLREAGRRIPLALVTTPGRDGDAVELALPVGADLVYRDRLAPLTLLAQRVTRERRRRILVALTRATAHELNNLLAPVALAVSMLRTDADASSTAELVETIALSHDRASAVVGSLYKTALWADGEDVDLEGAVDLRQMMEAVARHVRHRVAGVEVETDYPPDLPALGASPEELRQVLLAMVSTVLGRWGGRGMVGLVARSIPEGSSDRVHVVARFEPEAGRKAETGPVPEPPPGLPEAVERLDGELSATATELRLTLPAGRRPRDF